MQSLLDWLNLVDWGEFNFFKFFLLAIIILLTFDGVITFVFSCILSLFKR